MEATHSLKLGSSRLKSGMGLARLSIQPGEGRKVSRCLSLGTYAGGEGRRKISTMKPVRQYMEDRKTGAEGRAKKEGVSTLVGAMRHFADSLELQVAGCKIAATRNSLCEGGQDALTVVEAVVNALKAFSGEENLVDWALAAIGKLLADDPQPATGERIAAIGGVGLVMGVTNTFRDKPGIQARACNTMGHLAASEELARVVAAAGGVQSSMAAMKEFPDDVAVQKNGCHALSNMAVEESVASDVIDKDGLSLILSAMKKYADDSELQDSACRALGSLAACEEVCRQVGQAGSIKAVMDAMKSHKESVGVQECGCWALVSLSEDYNNCSDLLQAGALDVALYAMEMFYTGEALQEYCCRMLANMAAADDFDTNLASEKVVEALLGAMERYTKNLEIQEHALFTLGKVILESDAVLQPVLKNDGVNLVSEALKAFRTNINVQRGGCRAFGALAMHEDAKDEIINGGGLDIILSVLKQEKMEENEVVQMICCNALASLVDTEDVKVKVKVCEEGGLSGMLHAIQTYPDDAELCECVCRAISSLAGCNDVIEHVRAAGAFQQVLAAMGKHPGNPEVQESAVHALRLVKHEKPPVAAIKPQTPGFFGAKLALILPSNQSLSFTTCFRYADLLKSGGTGRVSINALVAAISAGMRALPEDQVVQTNGCRLLAHIALNDTNQLAIAKECGVKAVLVAMKNFPSDSAIQESSCRVLGLLSYHSETQQYVTRLGGIEATLAAMTSCGSPEVLVAGCGTLTCLAVTEKNIDRIRDDKGVERVVSAMKKFEDRSDLQLTGCLALKLFAETKEVAKQVVAAGGEAVIRSAMERFPASAELLKEAQDALDNIKKHST